MPLEARLMSVNYRADELAATFTDLTTAAGGLLTIPAPLTLSPC